MSLNIPLAVRLGDKHITREISGVSFRREAVGGLRSISLRLSRDIGSLAADLTPFTKVYLYDARTAETVAEGRLADSGRAADTSGQAWDIVAFGPVQHASDITTPLIYVERSISDGWARVTANSPEATMSTSPHPGDSSALARQGMLASFPEGSNVDALGRATLEYRRILEANQKIARIAYSWDTGLTHADWFTSIIVGTAGSAATTTGSAAANVAGGTTAAVVITNWANTMNTCRLEFVWTNVAAVVGADTWAWFDDVVIRSVLMTSAGVEITTGYTANYVLAHEVVSDLLGRLLGQYDGAGATIATTGTTQIASLAYPDGVTPEQVLSDLMAQEPAFRWYTTPDKSGNGYGFRWELWPTTVRYEVTLDDGGNFPLSAQELYNQVRVSWRDLDGSMHSTLRTLACQILDDAGIVRQAQIELGSELGSLAAADQAGDTFLAEHNVPKNSGTIKVNRPIRDLVTGRMVDPFWIEAGELIRVRGVESHVDSLNADSNDGQTVFRIFAMDYTSDDNSANLSLDADPTDVASILARLMTERRRR